MADIFTHSQEKSDNAPRCASRGSQAIWDALRAELGKAGLGDEVQVTTSGSIGLCEHGPNMVVYLEGVRYSGVQLVDVHEIVKEHLVNGRPVVRLAHRGPVTPSRPGSWRTSARISPR